MVYVQLKPFRPTGMSVAHSPISYSWEDFAVFHPLGPHIAPMEVRDPIKLKFLPNFKI